MGCGNSQISSLNINNTPLLISLHCVQNNLVSLDVSGRAMLTTLNCDQNQLTSLSFEGCTALNYIACSHNQLTNLDFSGFESLSGISCYSNQLTSLNVSGCSNLTTLMCYINHLTTLDISDSPLLYKLWAIDNDLTWLSVKNGSTIIYDDASWLIQGNPLEYLCVDENETEIAYFTTFCQNAGMNPVINTYCSFTPEGDYSIITGTVRYSPDNISCTDGQPLQYFRISLADSSNPEIPVGAVYTNDEGQYTIYTSQSLTVVPMVDNAYFISNPALAAFTYTTPQTYNADFCVTNTTTSLHDLDIVILPLTVARPGLDASYKVIVTNNGNSTESGTVNFQYEDAILTYANSDISSPVSADGNISWNITGLAPLTSLSYTITFHMDTNPQNTGAILSSNAGVEIDNTDNEPQNNSFTLSQVIVNSYDPNDKQVAEGASITPEKVGEYLHYLVRFQNSGTAEAINVVVKDMLANNLDWATFKPISASHAYRTTLTQGNKAEFFFEGINLPAEQDDEPGSHGYIAFKIKPAAGAVIGDVFENTADIYFDYNAPIITNTVSTAVKVLSVGSLDFDKYFTLYPVPAKDVLDLDVKDGSAIKAISVYNTLGQLVISSVGSDLKNISTSSLKTGTYIVKVFSDKGAAIKKITKQ